MGNHPRPPGQDGYQPCLQPQFRGEQSDGKSYDLTSTYFEGRCCPLAKRGYSRDGRRDKLQIVFGLLCNREGCPVAVEVFDGNTADPSTVGVHIEKLRQRFALSRVVLVGDRGMLTEARIREEVAPAGLDWISALRAPAIRELMSSGAVQRSMFDDTDLAEVRCDAYPGERLIVCRNERLAQERARKREALLQATEALLAPIAAATQREKRRLSGKETIAMRVGKVIGKYKMAKHFELDITETAFAYHRKADAIATEAALDGLYIVRTSVPTTELDAEHTVRAYKGLSVVERAFRSLKTVDLKVRPIYCYRRREMTRNRPSRKCANHGLDKGCSLATGPRRRRDIKEMVKKMPGSTQHLHTGRLRPFSERR